MAGVVKVERGLGFKPMYVGVKRKREGGRWKRFIAPPFTREV